MRTKFDKAYYNIMRRNVVHYELPDSLFYSNMKMIDIVCESILPSPHRLIEDIIQRLKNDEHEFTYRKNDIKRLSDRYWKFYDDIGNLPNDFRLTVIKCSDIKLLRRFRWLKTVTGTMMEFGNPEDSSDEHIWIFDKGCTENESYGDDFKNLLLHELGHVWTFGFGMADDAFKHGQAPMNKNHHIDFSRLTEMQRQVLSSLYNWRRDLLQFDYEYILCASGEEDFAAELSVHIDNIIEILVDDYLNFNSEMSTESYLDKLFSFLNEDPNYVFSDFTLHKLFKNKLKLKNHNTLESVKNPIRRLFMIYAFGTKAQKEYFKIACEEEFGKMKNEK